jgi:PucR C-terminal helix-turn-helix domain/GGDEF-like domain
MGVMTAPTSMSHHEAAATVVAAVRAEGLPELVRRIVARIRGEIPCYAGDDVVHPDDLRASVRANVDYILDSLTGTAQANLSAPDATGRTRAGQGVPLAEMLTAYRIGVTELWSALVTAARGLPDVVPDDIIDLADAVFAAQNTYSDAALGAYRDEAREILRTQERERAALVEVILTGVQAKGTLWEVANALRLPLDGAFLVVAAETELGHDPIPRAESALAVIDVRSVWRLDAELSLGVLSLPDRTRNGAVLTVLDRHATRRIGASPVFAELHQASWALQLARLALGSHTGSTGVAQFRDNPIDVLVAAAPHAALEAARTVLGGLLELPEEELDLLLGTFEAWVRASGSATVAGAALYCHPNTVRYRLRRIEAGTGRTLAHPGDVAELVTAVRAWRELPHS